jgi:glycerate 2-kinase
MKVLIAPDKFKGSLTAVQVCDAIETGIKNYLPQSQITKIPLADGGEGSLDILEKSIFFKRIFLKVKDPLFRTIASSYGILDDTAYIEMASASGLQLLREDERNPIYTTSFGTGEMILDAVNKGATKINLFVGGSASNDAGIGMASALGYIFKDEHDNILSPIGANLIKVKTLDFSKAISFDNIELNILTDVKNTLYGKNGAAYLFASQKGASSNEIDLLDKGLKHFSEIIISIFDKDYSCIPGTGAARGVGITALAFYNAKIKSGIDTIFDLIHFNKFIEKADVVISGEGLLDSQTLKGKVVKGVFERCKNLNKPLGIVCGDLTLNESELGELDATIIKPIKIKGVSKEDSMQNAYSYLVERSEELIAKF